MTFRNPHSSLIVVLVHDERPVERAASPGLDSNLQIDDMFCALLKSATAGDLEFTVKDVTDDAYTTLNLARNGQLSVKLNELAKDTQIVSALKSELGQADSVLQGTTCEQMQLQSGITNSTFQVRYVTEEKEPTYREMVQTALDVGLMLPELESYPTSWDAVWEQPAGANVSKLLWSTSDKVGCVVGVCTVKNPKQESSTGYLFCRMNPTPTENGAAFTKAYYDELMKRKTTLAEMTEGDLKASAGASSIAVPSVLLASLITITATIAA
ncbi:SAG family member [Eimeria maxima]|uniref:SAG family member n=1 Tax=Eimeria maxima TaxID=5804 RepID=U6M6N8_EIMMA|nr:SAG family member [Eimeria maxima]CDJ59681.1 SAG family member [Eimeria maxima]